MDVDHLTHGNWVVCISRHEAADVHLTEEFRHAETSPTCERYIQEYTTIWLRISGYGAAEVLNDFAEELKQTEANPMCSIH